MKYLSKQVVFREIPDEITLSYLISGCPLRCPECHSMDSWSPNVGFDLLFERFAHDLEKNKGWITCVLFLGGEWSQSLLIELLIFARSNGLKTALYTGLDAVHNDLLEHLDYLKTGPYKKELGGLSSPKTNQKLINLRTGEVLNPRFQINMEVLNDSTK